MKIPIFQILALIISMYAAYNDMISWIITLLFWLTICTFSITINGGGEYIVDIKELISKRKDN